MFPYVGLRRGDAARFGKRHIPVTKRGSKDEDYSGHGLRKASATIVARAARPKQNSTRCSAGAAIRWRSFTSKPTTGGWPRVPSRRRHVPHARRRGDRNSPVCTSKRDRPGIGRSHHPWEVVISKRKPQSGQLAEVVMVGEVGLEPTKP